MHQQMGLNLIRVWGGGLTERPEFFEACDELGVLVMQEFWMSGAKTPLFAPFVYKMHHFTKTGSGQT
jgi:beta-galactosidase/beta-glucuronidase